MIRLKQLYNLLIYPERARVTLLPASADGVAPATITLSPVGPPANYGLSPWVEVVSAANNLEDRWIIGGVVRNHVGLALTTHLQVAQGAIGAEVGFAFPMCTGAFTPFQYPTLVKAGNRIAVRGSNDVGAGTSFDVVLVSQTGLGAAGTMDGAGYSPIMNKLIRFLVNSTRVAFGDLTPVTGQTIIPNAAPWTWGVWTPFAPASSNLYYCPGIAVQQPLGPAFNGEIQLSYGLPGNEVILATITTDAEEVVFAHPVYFPQNPFVNGYNLRLRTSVGAGTSILVNPRTFQIPPP